MKTTYNYCFLSTGFIGKVRESTPYAAAQAIFAKHITPIPTSIQQTSSPNGLAFTALLPSGVPILSQTIQLWPNDKPTLHIKDDYKVVVPPFPFSHLWEASQHYRKYIEDNDYGARDAGDGVIKYKDKVIARVSYNGKIWRKWSGPDQLLYDPYAVPTTV